VSDASSGDEPSGGGALSDNPFLVESSLPFGLPPFDRIEQGHFKPAFERGMAEQLEEIAAIATNPDPPSFDNVFAALERSGRLLDRARGTFSNLVSSDTDDEKEVLRSEMAPRFAAHADAIVLDAALFERVAALHRQLDSIDLDDESRRLVERTHRDFVRAGANLPEADKEHLKALNAELAELTTRFSQNVLQEVNASAVVVDSREELAGLSGDQVAAAAQAAAERGVDGRFVLALQNTSVQPVLASLDDRGLRRRVHEASVARGSRGNDLDNRAIVSRVAALRAERAALLGYPDHATYVLEDQTALTTEAVNRRLNELVAPAVANARRETSDLQEAIAADGGDFELEPWDWAYYSEKVRQARFDFDDAQLRPYLELDTVLQRGVFFAANRLFGLTFEERTDLPAYHPDVRVFEVRDVDGTPLALFLADYYARRSKRGGAWMSSFVSQSRLLDEHPVIVNNVNVPKPPEGEPTLLTFDLVTTMFHEFGHALHGMFSDVRYPSFSGTSVPRDFVEFPSQVNEMWATWPEVVANYAVHHETGEPLPADLLERVLADTPFNQGYMTVEYLAASLVDQALHQRRADEVPDAGRLLEFEAAVLHDAGVDLRAVPPRYRLPYFSHILGGYDAGYYSYIWAEVLDADAVEWFKENGGLTRANGDRYRARILSRGGSADEMALYRDFRGRDAAVEPLLQRRALISQ
jgi:peptidyl-dipeptidase Dcp